MPRATLITLLACSAALAWIQFSFAGLLDGDSYFHTRASQQLLEHGVRRELPQASFSTWRERYSDKDFLFHVLLIPFCANEAALVSGGKLAVVAFDFLLLAALALALHGLGIRFAPLWILLFLSTHRWLVEHLLALRPHLLALALLALELLLLLRGRWRALAVASACHVLAHSSFVLVPALPLAQGLARVLRREPLPLRNAAAVLGGLAAATLLHPYFPNNLSVAFDQLVEVARSVWGLRTEIPRELFGTELLPLPAWAFWRSFPGWAPAALGLLGLALARRRCWPSERTLTLLGVAVGLLLLSALSMRFFAFFALVSALLAGSLWTELAGTRSLRALWREAPLPSTAAALALLVCLGVGQSRSHPLRVARAAARYPSPELYRPAIAFLDAAARPDELVYHSFWRSFAWLYHFRPDGRYIEGLDPIFLYRAHPELFLEMLSAYRGETADVYRIVAQDFGARWVFVPRSLASRPFRALLDAEPRFRLAYRDEHALVYEVLAD